MKNFFEFIYVLFKFLRGEDVFVVLIGGVVLRLIFNVINFIIGWVIKFIIF